MNIEVTKDLVKILESSDLPNENEYKITTCYFNFDEFTSEFQVKRAIFTVLSTGEMYETDIINDRCDIPSEVLKHEYETVKLGVYGFNAETVDEEDVLLERFSPSYDTFVVPTGSYEEGALSPEMITPTQYDMYSQALQEGLQEVDDKLDEVVETVDGKLEEVDEKLEIVDEKIQEVDDTLDDVDSRVDGKIAEVDIAISNTNDAIERTNNLNLDVSDKVDGDVTVTLTKKDASTKSVVISDGTSLEFVWQGTSLGVKTEDMEEYVFVDLQGVEGPKGDTGEPFRIKKTYPSVADMNADFDNMEYGDYVMIASSVEIEDNAKLYTRGESQWIFITDFSGATGIRGETGLTPNIQIGTVTSGSTPSVTRTGTNENPVLNFVLQPGPEGQPGQTGATGNGISSVAKTSTSGLVDTYTITFTNGNTTTFNVTNGNGIDRIELTSQSGATKVYTIYFTNNTTTTFTVEDGEVTQEVFDEEVDRLKMVYNALPKVSDEDTELTLNNTAECPVYEVGLKPSPLEQNTTTGKNLFNINALNITNSIIQNNKLILTGTNDYHSTVDGNHLKDIANLTVGETYTLKFDTTYTGTNKNKIFLRGSQSYWESGTSHTVTQAELDDRIAFYGTNNAEISNIQINEGSTVLPYEPYTGGQPSPSPSYPQQIHVVTGDNSISVYRNFFDISTITQNTYINANNGVTGNSNATNLSDYIELKDTSNCFLDYEYTSLLNSSDRACCFYDNNKTFISGSLYNPVNKEHTLTTPANAKYARFSYDKNCNDIKFYQKEQTYPLTLDTLEYCKIGDYEDIFFKNVVGSSEYQSNLEDGKWYLKKNIGKVVLDGSEYWSTIDAKNTGNTFYSTTTIIDTLIKSNALNLYSDNFTNITDLWENNNAVGTQAYNQVASLRFRILKTTLSEATIDGWKSWLNTHNTIVYYILNTPTYTLLNSTLQTQLDNLSNAISYEQQTNVSQVNDDLPFVIKMSAIRDMSGIFDLIQ